MLAYLATLTVEELAQRFDQSSDERFRQLIELAFAVKANSDAQLIARLEHLRTTTESADDPA